jgi:hypothetical protein
MMKVLVVAVIGLVATGAAADDEPTTHLQPRAQADLGLSVVYLGYERPVADHVAVAVGVGIFGTYFLPWFDLGQDVQGAGVGTRATWFAHANGRGLYVAPYLRLVGVRDPKDHRQSGLGFTTGAFVGWAFAVTDALDLRIGAGAQYIRFHVDTVGDGRTTSTPFLALDLALCYRL